MAAFGGLSTSDVVFKLVTNNTLRKISNVEFLHKEKDCIKI